MNQEGKNSMTEREKVLKLYKLIGERGLYVNSSYDIFEEPPQEIPVNSKYIVRLAQQNTQVYCSSLLFPTLTSLMNHGTLLVHGAPGIGKTTSLELAGHFF